MNSKFELYYHNLKNKSDKIFENESQKLDLKQQNLIGYILMCYDFDVLKINQKNKDYDLCFELRNRLIKNLTLFLSSEI
jgi:hypothetical protein